MGPPEPLDSWLANWLESRNSYGARRSSAAAGAWSPDGSRIAVLTTHDVGDSLGRGDTLTLETMDPDGRNRKVLVTDDGLGPIPEHAGYQDIEARVSSCSAGFVIHEPADNPGLVQDCRTLLGLRDTLGAAPA